MPKYNSLGSFKSHFLPYDPKKTAPFYFSNNFMKPTSILIFLACTDFNKFSITCTFHIFVW